MDKELGWWMERLGGPLMFIMTIGVCYKANFHPECIKNIDLILSKTADLSFIIFGFLLAFIGLILGTRKKIVKTLKEKTFSNILDFNTRVILLSLVAGAFSFVLWTTLQINADILCSVKRFLLILLMGVLVWLIFDLVYFMVIFFKIIKNYS